MSANQEPGPRLSRREKRQTKILILTLNPNLVGSKPVTPNSRLLQSTELIRNLCENNYAAIKRSRFPRLKEIRFSGIRLCPHDRQRQADAALPLFDAQGAFALLAQQFTKVILTGCALCGDCARLMGWCRLQRVQMISLAQNHLPEFPLAIARLPELRELDISANVEMYLEDTCERLRQLEAEGGVPVMRQLRVSQGPPQSMHGYVLVIYVSV